MQFNEYQSTLEDLQLSKQPKEIQEQFYEFLGGVPYIRRLVDSNRPRVADLPKDEEGKVIVDVTRPHILENMDYFRPAAIQFQKTGKYTNLRPNPNPNSEFYKWLNEEVRRCRDGYVRPDGEWITGDFYFFLNYCPIQLIKEDKKGKKIRTIDFPKVWEGHYYVTHYLQQARDKGLNAAELASRGKGKSYLGASLLARRYELGESDEVNKKVQCVVTASERKYLTGANQILDMFKYYIDFLANNTQFPSKKLTDTMQGLQWTSGYIDQVTNTRRGSENAVTGITSKDDESKLRGSRGVLYLIEEFGTFPRLLQLYNNMLPSVGDGDSVWGLIFAYGTAGDTESDFSAAQELMYNPVGYKMYALDNVYDLEGQGRNKFTYFFPGYINRDQCYDNNGNSDVTKALLQILKDRYVLKYNSTDPNSLTKRIAEIPITPQEAILKAQGNIFPVSQLVQRLNELDNDPNVYSNVYVGELVFNSKGVLEYTPTADLPIREFPLKDNKSTGAIEFYQLPQEDSSGEIPYGRYIIGHDPVDQDTSGTLSLTSTFVLDLWTDRIVAEYTGRQQFADDNYEIVRKLCLFYNAKCLYERNKMGLFSYFSRMNSLYLLEDTPPYLKDKQIIKEVGYGNTAKGVNATQAVNNHANMLLANWLIKPVVIQTDDGQETTVPNLSFIKSRALLKELILYNPVINVDRVRAMGMVMMFREQMMVTYQGDFTSARRKKRKGAGYDDYFTRNYDAKLSKFSK